MSLPNFSTQSSLFSTAALSGSLFAETDRYRLFGKLAYPQLVKARSTLEKCYCPENGRIAIEPVLMLGVSILQELDGVPDRQAVEMLRYHAGWNFALNRQLGDPVFHPTSLVNFRHRLEEHQQSGLGFKTILDALQEAGLVSRQSRQRLDSTQMFGRVARMSRLDCVRETLRLALEELEPALKPEVRPVFWVGLWERYVASQVDYRTSLETLTRKLVEAGTDACQLLEWLQEPGRSEWAAGPQGQLLKRVFAEQFDVVAGSGSVPLPKEKEALTVQSAAVVSEALEAGVEAATVPAVTGDDGQGSEAGVVAASQPELAMPMPEVSQVQPKDKSDMSSARVQNPHEPEASYAVKGQGQKTKEHIGYKAQVAESVSEAVLAPGEPTRNFITGILTHAAHESDEVGAQKMEQEQAQMGLEKPPVLYVDGAYVSAEELAQAQAQAQGREIIGPAQPAPQKDGRFSVEDFQISIEQAKAICPAGKTNTQFSRLEDKGTGKVNYRFAFSTHCRDCPLRDRCLGKNQPHRIVVVGQYHSFLQERRKEQQTDAFKRRMHHRNGIEGTQSELVRGHGLRRARYRGLAKARLQNYFIGAACNVKRWIRREAWKIQQALSGAATQQTAAALS